MIKTAFKNISHILPDKLYITLKFKMRMGRWPHLNNPQTFNEKLQWLKLYDRRPEYTTMVDKYEVKKYVASIIGEEYIIPTLGVWDRFEDIDFDKLPEQFVLKCTHDSGGLVICRDKSTLDIEAARKKISTSLKRNYYWGGREWPYKNIKPRIIAEKYMQNGDNPNLPVYKIFTFNGEPKVIQTIQNDKTAAETIDYFTTDWVLLDMRQNFPNSTTPLERPRQLFEMLMLSHWISKGISFVRTDFYEINNSVFFSEFTFYSDNGNASFSPDSWDKTLGDWLKLPEKHQSISLQ